MKTLRKMRSVLSFMLVIALITGVLPQGYAVDPLCISDSLYTTEPLHTSDPLCSPESLAEAVSEVTDVMEDICLLDATKVDAWGEIITEDKPFADYPSQNDSTDSSGSLIAPANAPLGSDFGQNEPVFSAPISVTDSVEERVNLFDSSLEYRVEDFVLPGVNGLDLVISRRYKSSNANYHYPTGHVGSPTSETLLIFDYSFVDRVPDADGWIYGNTIRSERRFYDGWNGWQGEGTTNLLQADRRALTHLGYMQMRNMLNHLTTSTNRFHLRGLPGIRVFSMGSDRTSTNRVESRSADNNTFELGAGWNFEFTHIDTFTQTVYLADGRTFDYVTNGTHLFMPSYVLKDVELKIANGTYNGQAYRFSLYYKDGTVERLNTYGEMVAKIDRHGNAITFAYTTVGTRKNVTITDTMGRQVQILKRNTPTGFETVVSYLGQEIMVYDSKANTAMRTSGFNQQYQFNRRPKTLTDFNSYNLVSATDQLGNATQYTHQDFMGRTEINAKQLDIKNPVSFTGAESQFFYAALTKVEYPTGLTSHYTYTARHSDWLYLGGRSEPAILSRYDMLNNIRHNQMEYKYSFLVGRPNNPRQTNPFNPADMANGIWYSVISEDGWGSWEYRVFEMDLDRNMTKGYFFSHTNGKLQKEEVYINSNSNSVGQLYQCTSNTWHSSGLPLSRSTVLFNGSAATQPATVSYEYSFPFANVRTETSNFVKSYQYHPTFHYPTRIEYDMTPGLKITEIYTPTANGRSIASSEIRENNIAKTKTQFIYDSRGNITEIRAFPNPALAAYERTVLTYDSTGGNLLSTSAKNVKNADGVIVGDVTASFEYDAYGRIKKQTDPNGAATEYFYNALGDVTEIRNLSDGSKETFVYNYPANTVEHTDLLGTRYRHSYDRAGNLRTVTDISSGQAVQSFNYDTAYRQIRASNNLQAAGGHTVITQFDSLDRPLEVRTENSSGTLLSRELYDYSVDTANSRSVVRKTVVGQAGIAPDIITRAYINRWGFVERESVTLSGTEHFTTYTHDNLGNILTMRTPKDAAANRDTSRWTYNHAGKPTREYNALNQHMVMEYDGLGRLVALTDHAGGTTTFAHDSLSRLLSQSVPFEPGHSAVTKYHYDPAGNITREQTQSNAPGAAATWTRTDYEYTSRGFLRQADSFNGNTLASRVFYTHDAAGNVLTMRTGTDTASHATTAYTYDRFGNVLTITDALGQTETYIYNLNGLVTSKTDRNGTGTTYTYDGLGRPLSQITITGDPSKDVMQSWTYTLTGALRTENNGAFTQTNTYDALGRLTQQTEPGGIVKAYTYDIVGNRTSYTISGGTTTYEYDTLNRLEKVFENNTLQATYTYDANGNRASLTYSNGVTSTYTYNLANLVTSLTNKRSNTELSKYTYTYFLDGNQRTKTDNTGRVTTYTYDGLGRLTQEAESGGSTPSANMTMAYTFDGRGNRETMTVSGAENYTVSYKNDLNNRLLETTKSQGGIIEITVYGYDPNGNQISKLNEVLTPAGSSAPDLGLGFSGGFEMYIYDGLNRLISVNMGGETTDYAYRPDGLRHSKSTNNITTTHIWDGANISLDIVDGVASKYVRGIGLISSGGIFYLYNAHGDVVQLTNASGNVTKAYDYDAFGVERNPDPNDTNPWRYCGEYFDRETGTVYLRFRNYQPRTGRFTQEDPYWRIHGISVYDPQGLNLYSYCMSNPVMWTDPSGLDVWIFYDPNMMIVGGANYTMDAIRAWRSDLATFYGLRLNQVHLVSLKPTKNETSLQILTREWNAMGTVKGKSVSIDAVVFAGHSNATSWRIFTDRKDSTKNVSVSADVINGTAFNQKDIGMLLLLGCNMGQTSRDSDRSNFASKMALGSHRFTEGVIAVNGTLYVGHRNSLRIKGNLLVEGSQGHSFKLYTGNRATNTLNIRTITNTVETNRPNSFKRPSMLITSARALG
jgi:RHS repeat-associated protein